MVLLLMRPAKQATAPSFSCRMAAPSLSRSCRAYPPLSQHCLEVAPCERPPQPALAPWNLIAWMRLYPHCSRISSIKRVQPTHADVKNLARLRAGRIAKRDCQAHATLIVCRPLPGQVSEWSNEHAWKACVLVTVPRVRIPPCPPRPRSRTSRARLTRSRTGREP